MPSIVAVESQRDTGRRRGCGGTFDGGGLIPHDDVNQPDSGLSRGEDGPADERHSSHGG
jgi:hypothetical protein